MRTKAIFLILLFVFSVTTLLLSIFIDGNTIVYTISTVVGHIALVLFGFYYARSKHEKFIDQLRKDIFN